MLPTLYTYKRAIARASRLEGPQAALLCAGVIYFVNWIMVGRISEVRIFMPFAIAMMPLAANLATDAMEAASSS